MLTLHAPAPEIFDESPVVPIDESNGLICESNNTICESNSKSCESKDRICELNEVLTETANEIKETKNDATDPEDTFWEELELIGELAEAERNCQSMESTLAELKREVKDTKKAYDAAVIKVRMVASKIMDLASGRTLPKSVKPSTQSSELTSGDSAQSPEQDWQSTPTAELLAGTKGLGAKKLDSIIELAPTAGKLEELRGEASRQCKSFREVLPKGCGQAIADAIEDRLIELVAKCCTPSASEQAGENADDEDDDEGEIDETDVEDEPGDEESSSLRDAMGGDYEDVQDDLATL